MGETEKKRTRRRMKGAERRRVIMGAAMEEFARRGYQAASLDVIARSSGVSKPVIYDHFSSKQELHVALLEDQLRELLAHVAARVPEEGSAEVRLRGGIEAFFGFVEEHPYAWRMLFREVAGGAEVAEAHRRIQKAATGFSAGLLAREPFFVGRDGPGRERAVEMLAEMLKSGLNGLAAWWYEHPDVPREDLVAVATGYAWLGLDRLRPEDTAGSEREPGR